MRAAIPFVGLIVGGILEIIRGGFRPNSKRRHLDGRAGDL